MSLDHAYLAARDRWTGVELPRDVFDAWVNERAAAQSAPERVGELYLACACVRGDSRAHSLFEQTFFGALTSVLSRFGADRVDDVKQQLREHLFLGVRGSAPKLATFSGQSGLDRWLRAVATRMALKGSRKPEQVELEDEVLSAPLGSDDPQLAHLKKLYRAEFKKAFADAMVGLEPEARTYLRLYYLDQLGLSEIASTFGSSAPTVSRRLSKARLDVLEATESHLRTRLKLTTEEVESIMRLIQSRLSIGDALKQP